MNRVLIAALVAAIIIVSGCTNGYVANHNTTNGSNTPEPTEINITDNRTPENNELEFILLDREGEITRNLCTERGLDDKIIVIESKYCGACKIAVPRLREIESELGEEFIFLDLSRQEDSERLMEFRVMPQYTPTIIVGCNVLIGAYSKESFKGVIEAFLESG